MIQMPVMNTFNYKKMKQMQTELEAVVTEVPSVQTVFNPATLSEDEHLAYYAEIQYKRKPPQVRMIMCSRLDPVSVGQPVMISYHCGMRCYQHSRSISTSSEDNCIGGFYFTDGTPA